MAPGKQRGDGSRFRIVLIVALVVLALDQLTKGVILARLALHESLPVIPGVLNIVHVRNPGAAFSLLAGAPEWFRGPFFIVITVGAIVLLLVVISRLEAEEHLLRIALGSILGGAIGNLADRIAHGEVIDFIDVHWQAYHWPAFNVADSSITVAVAVVVAQSLFARRSSRSPTAQND